jgi:methyltransferase
MNLVLLATIVFAPMLIEAAVSRRNESRLRARGAVEPSGDVYRLMQAAYPLSFLAMLAEGALKLPRVDVIVAAGFTVFLGAKLLKYWAITTLGERWAFRVLVPPGSTLVAAGPYRFIRHPNYVAVMGELAGAALIARAPVSGAIAAVLFGLLIVRRIGIEESALGLERR